MPPTPVRARRLTTMTPDGGALDHEAVRGAATRNFEVLRADLVAEEQGPIELKVRAWRVYPADADRAIRRISKRGVVRRRMTPLLKRATRVGVPGREILAFVVGVVSDAREAIERRAPVRIDVREVSSSRHVGGVFERDGVEQRYVDERRESERFAVRVDSRERVAFLLIEVDVVAGGVRGAGEGDGDDRDETRHREEAKLRVKHSSL